MSGTLKATAGRKYGLVTVRNANGTLNRAQFKIDASALENLIANRGNPWDVIGITQNDWNTLRVQVDHMALEVNDAELRKDDTVLVKYGERFDGSRFLESYFIVPKGAYSGTFPAITVTGSVTIKTRDAQREDIVSCVAGVLTTQPRA